MLINRHMQKKSGPKMKKLNQHWQALEPAQEWEKKEKEANKLSLINSNKAKRKCALM